MISGADDIGWGPDKKTGFNSGHSVLGDLFKNLVKKRDEDPDDGATEPDDPTGISYTAPGRFYPVSGGAANQVPGYRPIDNFSFPGYGMPGAVNHPRAVNPMPVISSGLSPQPLWPGTRQGNLFGFKKGVTPIGSVERLKQQWLLPGSGYESNELEGSFIPSVLSSISPVTNTYPTTGNSEQGEGEVVETHFIQEVNGKYLGESKAYYDWARVNLVGEKVVTFPDLKINIKTIPIQEWKKVDSERNFNTISRPLSFDKKTVIDNFRHIVDLNRDPKLPNDNNNIREHGLLLMHDFNNKTLTSSLLLEPDNYNTPFNTLFSAFIIGVYNKNDYEQVTFYRTSFNDWKQAVDDRQHGISLGDNYVTHAKADNNIVIGISHTHPQAKTSRNNTVIDQGIQTTFSQDDLDSANRDGLPDIVIKVDVNTDISNDKKYTFITPFLVTKGLSSKDDAIPFHNDEKLAHKRWEKFLKEIEKNYFYNIIQKYD